MLVKRKLPNTYGYVRLLLQGMVDIRTQVTLGARPGMVEDDPRVDHGYVNRTVPLTDEGRAALLVAHQEHSRFVPEEASGE